MVLIGILFAGVAAKLANGPWLINSVFNPDPAPQPAKNLSPVIFSELLFLHNYFFFRLSRVTTIKVQKVNDDM